MGLDIFVHKVSSKLANEHNVSNKSDYYEIRKALNNNAKIEFEKKSQKLIKELYKYYEMGNYTQSYIEFLTKLKKQIPFFNYYDYYLKQIGYDYLEQKVIEVHTPDDVAKFFEEMKTHIFKESDAYFRKVNFLYAYFGNKLVNESCIASKEEIKQLIDTCNDVLKHKGDEDYAIEHLPTTSGFFFGFTDYSDWYYNNVKDCIKQMRKLYRSLKDDDFVLWDFSW